MMTQTILVIDREVDSVNALRSQLTLEGFRCIAFESGSSVISRTLSNTPDLILLDPMLADVSGFDVCQQLKQDRRTQMIPVILLTAESAGYDHLASFENGADDYVIKPFNIRELMLRIRVLLERSKRGGRRGRLSFGELQIDLDKGAVWLKHDLLKLTELEFRLLVQLASNCDVVQSRETLLEEVWKVRSSLRTRTVDTHVKRLREKLGSAGKYIETLRGRGYCLRVPAKQVT